MVDISNLFQGLGAMAMAFADPRQSLLMSQGIVQRNQQIQDRKRREERQRQELMLQQQKIAMEQARMRQAQANWAAEQAVREGRLGLQGRKYADAQARQAQQDAQYASYFGGGAPSAMPAAAPNPFDLNGNAPYSAVSTPVATPAFGPTDAAAAMQEASLTGMPALPQIGMAQRFNTLRPGLLSDPGAPPPGLEAPGQAASSTGDPEQDAFREWQSEFRRAVRTGNPRIIDAVAKLKPPAALVKLQMGDQEPEPKEGFTWARKDGKRVPENWTDPTTGETFQRFKQIPETTAMPGAEETRFIGLSRSVMDKSEQILRVADQLDKLDVATYSGSQLPLIGQFFSDTVGGRYGALVGQMITDSLYQVSGSEAPPREIRMRYELYAPKPWDSVATTRWKVENLRALSRYALEYRMNHRLDYDEVLSPEQMDALLLGHDKEFARLTNVPPPPNAAPPPGYSYTGWDPERKLHVYTNEDGEEQFTKPVEPVQ